MTSVPCPVRFAVGCGEPCSNCLDCCEGHCAHCHDSVAVRDSDGGLYTCTICRRLYHDYYACPELVRCTAYECSHAFCRKCVKKYPTLGTFPDEEDRYRHYYSIEWYCPAHIGEVGLDEDDEDDDITSSPPSRKRAKQMGPV